MPYTGPERRGAPSLETVVQLLWELNTKLEQHLEQDRLAQPQLKELVDILQKSKGVYIFFRILLYVGAPLCAAIYWVKEHVKL